MLKIKIISEINFLNVYLEDDIGVEILKIEDKSFFSIKYVNFLKIEFLYFLRFKIEKINKKYAGDVIRLIPVPLLVMFFYDTENQYIMTYYIMFWILMFFFTDEEKKEG